MLMGNETIEEIRKILNEKVSYEEWMSFAFNWNHITTIPDQLGLTFVEHQDLSIRGQEWDGDGQRPSAIIFKLGNRYFKQGTAETSWCDGEVLSLREVAPIEKMVTFYEEI